MIKDVNLQFFFLFGQCHNTVQLVPVNVFNSAEAIVIAIICPDNIEEAKLEFSNLNSIHFDDQYILVSSGETAITPFKSESNLGSI